MLERGAGLLPGDLVRCVVTGTEGADLLVAPREVLPPRTTDLAMPHVWDMGARLMEPVTRSPSANPLWLEVALAALVTLGIAAVGAGVSELAGAFGLALEMGARLEDIGGTIHAHPTLGEAFHEASLRALGEALHLTFWAVFAITAVTLALATLVPPVALTTRPREIAIE